MLNKTRVVHCKREPYDIYIGRGPQDVGWGNPFPIQLSALHDFDEYEGSRQWSLNEYRRYLFSRPDLMSRIGELRGKVLGCWCHPKPCHGNILAELADEQ